MNVMSATQSRFGAAAEKSRSTRSGAGRASLSRRVVTTVLASADAHDPGCTHQPGNALASMLLPCCPQLGMYTGGAVSLVRRHVDSPDPLHQHPVSDSTSRWRTT